jgi:hypothetical protein
MEAMTELHMTWIRAAAAVASYRRMYELAGEIAGHDDAEKTVRRAARRVLRSLERIIDLPIVEGARLTRAVTRFREMRQALEAVLGPLTAESHGETYRRHMLKTRPPEGVQVQVSETPQHRAGRRPTSPRRRRPRSSLPADDADNTTRPLSG